MAALGIMLLALGAILTFALNVVVDEVNLEVVGLILMALGAIALIVALMRDSLGSRLRTERHVSADGHHEVEESRSSVM